MHTCHAVLSRHVHAANADAMLNADVGASIRSLSHGSCRCSMLMYLSHASCASDTWACSRMTCDKAKAHTQQQMEQCTRSVYMPHGIVFMEMIMCARHHVGIYMCGVMTCHVMSCRIVSCRVMSCRGCRVVSCCVM